MRKTRIIWNHVQKLSPTLQCADQLRPRAFQDPHHSTGDFLRPMTPANPRKNVTPNQDMVSVHRRGRRVVRDPDGGVLWIVGRGESSPPPPSSQAALD